MTPASACCNIPTTNLGSRFLTKSSQGGHRLGAGGGEPSRSVGTEERGVPVARPTVQVVPDLRVDVVLGRPQRFRDPEGLLAARRRLAVLGVEVPAAADRFVAVYEHSVASPRVTVEVLHEQAPSTA
jgi:hypothetical protein